MFMLHLCFISFYTYNLKELIRNIKKSLFYLFSKILLKFTLNILRLRIDSSYNFKIYL